MYRLILIVDDCELATEIYFKREDLANRWLLHHYHVIAQLVFLLKQTRDFETEIRRVH
jgi:hypothetical protein